jgi:hypothetical protein
MDDKRRKCRFNFYAVVLMLLNFCPFLIMSFYNNPTTDDYWYGTYRLEDGLFYPIFDYYQQWGGRLTMALFLSFEPLRFGNNFAFKVIPILSVFIFILSLFFLLKKFTSEYLEKSQVLFVALGVSILYLSLVPSPFEAIYWYPSMATYLYGFVLIHLNTSLFLRFDDLSKNWGIFIILNLISIAIVCTSELVGLVWMGFQLIILTYDFLFKRCVFRFNRLLLFVGTGLGFLILFTAPGLANRLSVFPHSRDFQFALLKGLLLAGQNIFKALSINTILFIVLIYIIKKERRAVLNRDLCKKQICFFTFCLVIGTFLIMAVLVWSNGLKYLPMRVINLLIYYQLPLILIIIYKLLDLICVQIEIQKFLLRSNLKNSILIVLFGSLLLSYNSNNAIQDLFSGRAAEFNDLRGSNYKKLSESKAEIVQIDCLNVYPDTFYSYNHQLNEANEHFYKYFNIKEISCK